MKRNIFMIIVSFVLIFSIGTLSAFADSNSSVEKDLSQQVGPQNAGAIYYKFVKKSEAVDKTSAPARKVSADMDGKGYISVEKSITLTCEASITLSTVQHIPIMDSLSFSVGKSLTTKVGYSIYKDKAQTGCMKFQPYRVKYSGTLKTYNSVYSNINGGLIKTESVNGYYHKKLDSGFADGKYYISYE